VPYSTGPTTTTTLLTQPNDQPITTSSTTRVLLVPLPRHSYPLTVCRPSAMQADHPPPSRLPPGPGLSPPHAAPFMRASIFEAMDMSGFPTNRFAPSGGVGVHGSQTHHSARFHPFQSQSHSPNLAAPYISSSSLQCTPQCPHPIFVGSLGAHADISPYTDQCHAPRGRAA
jgi:hypothetical protein